MRCPWIAAGIGLVGVWVSSVFASEPVSFETAYAAGRTRYMKEDFPGARVELNRALTVATNVDQKARALLILGMTHKMQSQFDESRDTFSKVLDLTEAKPNFRTEAQLNIAVTYFMEGDRRKAVIELQKLLSMEGVDKAQRAIAESHLMTLGGGSP
jgi:Flp pilus assembly protein TadD